MRFIMRVLTTSLDKTKAEVVFTNLGLDDSFDVFSYGFGRVPGESLRAYTGAAFTPLATFRLDRFAMALQIFILASEYTVGPAI